MTPRVLWPGRAEALAALASAVLFALAFPPFPFVVPALLCVVPIAVAVARAADAGAGVRVGVRLGFWFGLAGYGASLYWIGVALSLYTNLAFLGWLAAVVAVAMVQAAVIAALYVLRRATRWPMAVLLPLCWVAGEYLLGHLSDFAFPWLPLGLATTSYPVLAQGADLSGVHFVSLWIAAVNGLLADAWLLRTRRVQAGLRLGGALAVVALAFWYGTWRMATVASRPVGRVAVVQPNVPQWFKWQADNQPRIIGMLASTTRQALGAGSPELVLWPEAPLPDFLYKHPAWQDTIEALATATHTPLLAGVIDWRRLDDAHAHYYNGAMLVDGDGGVRQPVYDKRRLVPMVERVPFFAASWFDWLGPYAGGYTPGHRSVVFHGPAGRFGALICYESIFPGLSRQYRRGGADFLVSLTNDAWFGPGLAPYQHFAHLVLRAIENRVGVVRAANTGFSGYIDPLGRVRARTGLYVPAAATYDVETTSIRTPYVRLGDWVGVLTLAATIALLLRGIFVRRDPPAGDAVVDAVEDTVVDTGDLEDEHTA